MLETSIELSRAGYLTAAMGRPLDLDAPEDFARGYHNFRAEDGERFGAAAEAEYRRIEGPLRAAGMLPDRRQAAPQSAPPAWERAMWLAEAFVAGLAMPGIIDGLRALGGGA